MTSAVATSTSGSLPPSQENIGGELESSVAPRKFSHAMADALLALGPDRLAQVHETVPDASDSAAEKAEDSTKRSDPPKRKAQDAEQIQSWLAALAGPSSCQSQLRPSSGTVGGQRKGVSTDKTIMTDLTTADRNAGSETQQKVQANQQVNTKTKTPAATGHVSDNSVRPVSPGQSDAKDSASPRVQTATLPAAATPPESSVQGVQRTELSSREWKAALASVMGPKPGLDVRAKETPREPEIAAHDAKGQVHSLSYQKPVVQDEAGLEGKPLGAQQESGTGEDRGNSSRQQTPERPATVASRKLDSSQSKSQASQSKAVNNGQMAAFSERGMSAAPYAGAMQARQQVNENAGRTEQNLPVAAMVAQSAQPVEKGEKTRPSLPDHLARNTTASTTAGAMAAPVVAGRQTPARAEQAAAQIALPTHVRQAIGDAILGMKHLGDGSVSVTLKPGGEIQLALHLKMQHGRCEALAVLERGDFKSVGAEWSQLQSRLAQQGIRLAPLISAADHSSWFGSGHFSSTRQGRHQAAPEDVPVALIAKTPARKSGTPSVAANGREWWA